MASSVAAENVLGCWKHLLDSASTSVYWTSVVRECSVHVLLRLRRRQVVWDSWVSSRTSQPTETSTSVVTPPLTDNQLSMYHSQTKLPLYFTQLIKLEETSLSPSKVRQLIALTRSLSLLAPISNTGHDIVGSWRAHRGVSTWDNCSAFNN